MVSAGHPPLIVVTPSGSAQIIEMDSDPLGIFSALVLQRKDIKVSPGDRFYLYTDGLIESSPGAPRRAGLERLVSACVLHHNDPLKEAAGRIAGEIKAGMADIKDDLLLLAIEVPE